MQVVCNKKNFPTEMKFDVWYFATRRNEFGTGGVISVYRPGFRVCSYDDPVLYLKPHGTISYSSYEYFYCEYEIVGEAERIEVF